jgi:hypothetical protein
LLRGDADPRKCYCDKRIESILKDIEDIGFNLSHYEEGNWKRLIESTLEIFKAL